MSEKSQAPNYQYLYERINELSNVTEDDVYARDANGRVFQKVVSFNQLFEPSVHWEPVETGAYCQKPSDRFMQTIEEHNNDPRSAMSSLEVQRKYNGPPDSRISDSLRYKH